MKSTRRKVEILVISDIHLGTYGSKAQELLKYLHTVDPEILILNGDIIDIWQFSKRYFPKSHLKVIKYLTGLLTKGTRIFYVTGNHDEMLRRFVGFELGEFKIVNTLLLELDGKKTWIFHGDVFDITMKHSMWLAKLGAIGYDALIHLNTFMNWISRKMGKGRISLSKKIKASVKGALKYINDFESTAAGIAIQNGYDTVICGHIHQPEYRKIKNKEGKEVTYLNSGDWVESMSSLEYNNQTWEVYQYMNDTLVESGDENEPGSSEEYARVDLKEKQLFDDMLSEFSKLAMVTHS